MITVMLSAYHFSIVREVVFRLNKQNVLWL